MRGAITKNCDANTALRLLVETAELRASQGIASTLTGAYLAYASEMRGAITKNCDANTAFLFFSYPDYITVGIGISPIREQTLFADCTAGGEFHPAPKNYFIFFIITGCAPFVKRLVLLSRSRRSRAGNPRKTYCRCRIRFRRRTRICVFRVPFSR